MSYRVATIDGLQDIAYRQDTHMRPVRHHLGITAFGTNAWTATDDGDRLMPEHREDEGKVSGNDSPLASSWTSSRWRYPAGTSR
jgi:hypothetical protein